MPTQLLVSLLGGVLMISCITKREEVDKTDKKKLQGSWKVEKIEANGLPITSAEPTKVSFAGNKIAIETPGWLEEGTYTLDPTKTPKTIDYETQLIRVRGMRRIYDLDSGTLALGIYSLEGDTLKICRVKQSDASMLPKKRPMDFATKPDKNRVMLSLRREKP